MKFTTEDLGPKVHIKVEADEDGKLVAIKANGIIIAWIGTGEGGGILSIRYLNYQETLDMQKMGFLTDGNRIKFY